MLLLLLCIFAYLYISQIKEGLKFHSFDAKSTDILVQTVRRSLMTAMID